MKQEKSKKYMQKFLTGKWQPATTLPDEWREAVKTASGGNVSGYIKKLIEADLKEKGLM